MTPTVTAEIVRTEVEAEYQGNVYERSVVIELDGTELTLFEGSNIVTDADCGSVLKLNLKAHLVKSVERTETDRWGIVQESDRESKWSATVVGRVVTSNVGSTSTEDERTAQIDVGPGTINLHLDNSSISNSLVSKGATVRAVCGRVDIVGRK